MRTRTTRTMEVLRHLGAFRMEAEHRVRTGVHVVSDRRSDEFAVRELQRALGRHFDALASLAGECAGLLNDTVPGCRDVYRYLDAGREGDEPSRRIRRRREHVARC